MRYVHYNEFASSPLAPLSMRDVPVKPSHQQQSPPEENQIDWAFSGEVGHLDEPRLVDGFVLFRSRRRKSGDHCRTQTQVKVLQFKYLLLRLQKKTAQLYSLWLIYRSAKSYIKVEKNFGK